MIQDQSLPEPNRGKSGGVLKTLALVTSSTFAALGVVYNWEKLEALTGALRGTTTEVYGTL